MNSRRQKEDVFSNALNADNEDVVVDKEAYDKYDREMRSAIVIQRYWRGYLARRRVTALRILGIRDVDVELLEKARSIQDKTRVRDWRAAPVNKWKLLRLLESRHETRTGYSHVRVYTLYLALVSTLVVLVQEPSQQFLIERPVLSSVVEGGDRVERESALNLYDITSWNGYMDWISINLIDGLFREDTSLVLSDGTNPPFSLMFALNLVESPTLKPFLNVAGLPMERLVAAQQAIREHYNITQEIVDVYAAFVAASNESVSVLDIANPPFIATVNKLIPGIFIYIYVAEPTRCSALMGPSYGGRCFKDEVNEAAVWTFTLWSHYDLVMARAMFDQLRLTLPEFLGKVVVDMTVYNGNTQRFAFLVTETLFHTSGHVSSLVRELGSVSTEPWTDQNRRHTQLTIGMLVLFSLSIVVFIFRELRRARVVIGYNGRGVVRYVTSFFCLLEWTTIVFGVVFVALMVDIYRRVDKFDFMDDQEIFQALATQDFSRLLRLGDNIYAISRRSRTTLVFASWVVVLSYFKIIKFFRFEGKVAHLARTLLSAAGDIGHFLIITLFLLFGLVIMGHVLFGHGAGGWSTVPASMMRVFEMIINSYNFAAMYNIEPEWAGIYLVVVSLVGAFILLNVFVAIILEGFAGVFKDDSMAVTLAEEFTEGMQRRSELFATLIARIRGKQKPPRLKFMKSLSLSSLKRGTVGPPGDGGTGNGIASPSTKGDHGKGGVNWMLGMSFSRRGPAMAKASEDARARAPKGMRSRWSLQTDLRHAIGWLHVWPGDTITMRALVRELSPMEADLGRLLHKFVVHLVEQDEKERREQEARMYGPHSGPGGVREQGWSDGGKEIPEVVVTGGQPQAKERSVHSVTRGQGGSEGGVIGRASPRGEAKMTVVSAVPHPAEDKC